jgi:hypothetical protein
MSAATHATIATFRMDLTREEEGREVLHRVIVPGVSASPGFQSGHWTLDRDKGESVVLVTFDSIENAEALAQSVRGNSANQAAMGIELLSIRIVEVSASA